MAVVLRYHIPHTLAMVSVSSLAVAQPFGRFGYADPPPVPGFILQKDGFRVNGKGASEFRYPAPYTQWRCTDLSDMGVTAMVSTRGLTPRKLKVNLLSPGFWLYFETGFSFTVSSADCPFLSWSDGSVGADVPTPEVDWALISFKDSEPPVLLSFPEGKCAVRVGGVQGNWTVRSVDTGAHWVHVDAPLGISALATSTAAQLGSLIQKITPNLAVWAGPEPKFKTLDIKSDAASVTATWHFDRPALVPSAVALASSGGYKIDIQPPLADLGAFTEDGPLEASATPDLTIRFPVLSFPGGRNLAAGVPKVHVDPPSSLDDWADALKLALGQWSCGSDKKTRDAADALASRFISECQDVPEPITGQKLPYDASGKGADVDAAYALLVGAQAVASSQPDSPNPLLLSLLLRRDWWRWEICCADPEVSRRATAIASVACATVGDPLSRLNAAMLQAGLAADFALEGWRKRQLNPDPPKGSVHVAARATTPKDTAPLADLRSGLFLLSPDGHPFFDSLVGPIQVSSELSLSARADPGQITLQWFEQDLNDRVIVVQTSAKLKIAAGKNVETFWVERKAGAYLVHVSPKDTGPTSVILTSLEPIELPAYAAPSY